MVDIHRRELVQSAYIRAFALTDYSISDLEKRHEFRQQFILADKSLTEEEKSVLISRLNINFDCVKVVHNKGTKRLCENCQLECLAILYCEHCIRNYLKTKFTDWTSGNNEI